MSPERDEIAARIIQVDQNLARLERKRSMRGGELNESERGQVIMLKRRLEELHSRYDALVKKESPDG